MHVIVTGGLGFIGRALVNRLKERGDEVTIIDRSAGRRPVPGGVLCIAEDLREPGRWQRAVRESDVVVNLAGTSIFRRWTPSVRRAIRESRVLTTRNIADVLRGAGGDKALINASAVGIYGPRGDQVLDESAEHGNDFLARVAADWEAEALAAEQDGARVACCRFGIALGPTGGAAEMLLPLFRCMMGAPIGAGRQWFPWIHVGDLVRILLYCIDHSEVRGPMNCTAPTPVTNRELSFTLSSVVRRPILIPFMPSWLLELGLGDFGAMLTKGQRAVPRRLQAAGFRFRYPHIRGALEDIEASVRS